MRILVKRTGAFGDVLATTPIVRRLKQENPDAEIDFQTHYTNVYEGNPDVTKVFSDNPINRPYDRLINLDGSFEKHLRKIHVVDGYSEAAFGDRNTKHALHFYWGSAGFAYTNLDKTVGSWDKVVVIHPCRNWPIRTLPLEWWQELVDLLAERGFHVIVTGTFQDHDGLRNVIDLRHKLTTQDQAALINQACCFVCSDSGPMILAQCTRTPVIAMTTAMPASLIVHERAGGYGWRLDIIEADVPCVGCGGRLSEPTTYFDCEFGHRNCVRSFDAKAIANLVEQRQVPNESR